MTRHAVPLVIPKLLLCVTASIVTGHKRVCDASRGPSLAAVVVARDGVIVTGHGGCVTGYTVGVCDASRGPSRYTQVVAMRDGVIKRVLL